jgi:hypothetical protein
MSSNKRTPEELGLEHKNGSFREARPGKLRLRENRGKKII